MAYTAETLNLTEDLRIYLTSETDEATRVMVRAWAQAWTAIQAEFTAAALQLIAMAEDGEWPTAWQVARATRAKEALAMARTRLGELADATGVDVIDRAGRVIDNTPGWQQRIVDSQLPDNVAVHGLFDRFDADALDAIVKRSTQRITSLMGQIPDEAYRALKQSLIRGVALGENPNVVAARLVRQAEHAWTAGLSRALTIARTEILDAHRASAAAHHAANADVIKGWRWQCSLSSRTCPACLSLNGSEHPLEELGPNGHQNCRCQRVPIPKTWKELGLDDLGLVEPPSTFPDSRAWFDDLPRAEQTAIMGRARLAALDSGALDWDEMAVLRHNPDWRDSWGVRPLSAQQLRKAA